ncbi:hypothetical protein SIN8267_00017 [Sinobacterium norvegicum]|uniref:Uncharacterized protein n=1 Tax=Sinobacterium norvegicum TaxID=1641715 RepID=A0ABM9A9R7_9GAMM|nr:hypothetical protein SIN8267_00017 [Sinobacterium norvegicum]
MIAVNEAAALDLSLWLPCDSAAVVNTPVS